MISARKRSGESVRNMRRIPVALTKPESQAVQWLKHFARPEQLTARLRPLAKKSMHVIIKALSTAELLELVDCWQRVNSAAPQN